MSSDSVKETLSAMKFLLVSSTVKVSIAVEDHA